MNLQATKNLINKLKADIVDIDFNDIGDPSKIRTYVF